MSNNNQKPTLRAGKTPLPGALTSEICKDQEDGLLPMVQYNNAMSDNDEKTPQFDRLLTDEELALAIKRRKKGMHLQEIEGNPLDAEDIAMFEMFERERWSHEKRLAYIKDDIKRRQEAKK